LNHFRGSIEKVNKNVKKSDGIIAVLGFGEARFWDMKNPERRDVAPLRLPAKRLETPEELRNPAPKARNSLAQDVSPG
jgi:hypothetical protein